MSNDDYKRTIREFAYKWGGTLRTATFEKLRPKEKLGPLDLGPDRQWWHLALTVDLKPFCGEPGDVASVESLTNSMARSDFCPDCLRIARARGYIT